MVQRLMVNAAQIKALSDDELLRRLSSLVERSRRTEAELVAHIAEVDTRRLFAGEAFPSMFQYCLDVLHLSEAEAYLRITAARTVRKHPMLLDMLADGRLHLTAVCKLGKHLTEGNRDEVLAKSVHTTKRKLDELIASLAPKPDVPTQIRKLPERTQPVVSKPVSASAKPESAPALSPAKPAPPQRRASCSVPLAPSRFKVQFTADSQLRDKLERLQALRPGVDLVALIDDAVTEKLERIEARKFGKVRAPRTSVEDADTSPGSRDIAAAVRRVVDARDQRQCTFVSQNGRRCLARDHLEYHHDEPYALGGDRSPENIRLVCKSHNLYLAERDYGKEKMAEYRRDDDGSEQAREPLAGFELVPERVADSYVWDDVWSEKPEGGELTIALVRQARSPGKLRKALATQGAAGTTPSLELRRRVAEPPVCQSATIHAARLPKPRSA